MHNQDSPPTRAAADRGRRRFLQGAAVLASAPLVTGMAAPPSNAHTPWPGRGRGHGKGTDPVTAATPRHHLGQAVAVEPRHPARDSITSGAPNQFGRHRVALPLGHGQQGAGTSNLGCRCTL